MKPPTSTANLVLADAAEIFSICNDAGISHRESLLRIHRRSNRESARELFDHLNLLDGGTPTEEVLESMSRSSDAKLREFALAIGLSTRLGTPLSAQLHGITRQIRHQWLVEFRLKSTQAETQMIFPQVAISLPLTILFALYPSLQMLRGALG
jgi:tight adherence protein C